LSTDSAYEFLKENKYKEEEESSNYVTGDFDQFQDVMCSKEECWAGGIVSFYNEEDQEGCSDHGTGEYDQVKDVLCIE